MKQHYTENEENLFFGKNAHAWVVTLNAFYWCQIFAQESADAIPNIILTDFKNATLTR